MIRIFQSQLDIVLFQRIMLLLVNGSFHLGKGSPLNMQKRKGNLVQGFTVYSETGKIDIMERKTVEQGYQSFERLSQTVIRLLNPVVVVVHFGRIGLDIGTIMEMNITTASKVFIPTMWLNK